MNSHPPILPVLAASSRPGLADPHNCGCVTWIGMRSRTGSTPTRTVRSRISLWPVGRLEIGPALLALIPAQGWRSEYDVGGERCEVPASAVELLGSDSDGLLLRSLRVWPDAHIEIIFRPWSPDEIIADVRLFDVQG